jgi:hypothetical protein
MLEWLLPMKIGERDRVQLSGTETVGRLASNPGRTGQRSMSCPAVRGLPGAGVAGDACERCRQMGRTCPSCVQRRRHAWSLCVERGESCESAGTIMDLDPELVHELVAAENERRELLSLRCDSIPVQRTQAVIDEALAREPDLRLADMAGWLEMQQADFERAFLGKGRNGRAKRRVTVANASRLMIALGRAPNELEGC